MTATRTLAILLFDDVEVLDFCGPFEIVTVANRFTGLPAFYGPRQKICDTDLPRRLAWLTT